MVLSDPNLRRKFRYVYECLSAMLPTGCCDGRLCREATRFSEDGYEIDDGRKPWVNFDRATLTSSGIDCSHFDWFFEQPEFFKPEPGMLFNKMLDWIE